MILIFEDLVPSQNSDYFEPSTEKITEIVTEIPTETPKEAQIENPDITSPPLPKNIYLNFSTNTWKLE
jgi:hypothetical protein